MLGGASGQRVEVGLPVLDAALCRGEQPLDGVGGIAARIVGQPGAQVAGDVPLAAPHLSAGGPQPLGRFRRQTPVGHRPCGLTGQRGQEPLPDGDAGGRGRLGRSDVELVLPGVAHGCEQVERVDAARVSRPVVTELGLIQQQPVRPGCRGIGGPDDRGEHIDPVRDQLPVLIGRGQRAPGRALTGVGVQLPARGGPHGRRGRPVGRPRSDLGQRERDMTSGEPVEPRRGLALPRLQRRGALVADMHLHPGVHQTRQRLSEPVRVPVLRCAQPPLTTLPRAPIPTRTHHRGTLVPPVRTPRYFHFRSLPYPR